MIPDLYCVKQKKKTRNVDPHLVQLGKGKAIQARCAECGTEKYQFVKKDFVMPTTGRGFDPTTVNSILSKARVGTADPTWAKPRIGIAIPPWKDTAAGVDPTLARPRGRIGMVRPPTEN